VGISALTRGNAEAIPATTGPARPRWRVRAAAAFFIVVVVVQLAFALNGYREPHKFFAFQPFNESSTWRADIVRVTWDGRRVAIDDAWPGYDWDTLVHWSALQSPDRLRQAYMGVGATVDFLDDALDWVAANTPADRETRYLEARVTYYKNTRGPHEVVLRSAEREPA
jgi:hypothetical protein